MKISLYTVIKINKNAWRIDSHNQPGTIIYQTRRAAIASVEDYHQQAFNGRHAYQIRDTVGRILSSHGYGV